MAWLAVDKSGTETIFENKPQRGPCGYYWYHYSIEEVVLPRHTIEKLIGHKLTWDDEPVELC